MRILSLCIPQHDTSVSLLDGDNIFAYEEERHTRIRSYKSYHNNFISFPNTSFSYLNQKHNINNETIDYVTSFNSDIIQFIKNQYNINIDESKFIKVDHHESHAGLAYYWSNFKEDTLVIVLDGGADNNLYGRYYIGRDGDLIPVGNLPTDNVSFGLYYVMITEFLGFKRAKDEGKIVGMSSHGKYDDYLYNLFTEYLKVDAETLLTPKIDYHSMVKDFYKKWFDMFGGNYWKNRSNDIAYNAQLVFEDQIINLVNGLKNKFPNVKNVALAGGVFANIKVNKRINDLDWVNEVFIAPPMGDEGLSLGSAYIAKSKLIPDFKPFELKNVFFGSEIETQELYNFDHNLFETQDYNPEKIAEQIAYGKVIGFIQGKYEHGPRALGARSILAHPGLDSTYKKVNDRLKRNDFMPFAPSVLSEKSDEIFNCNKSKYTGEFMTMLYDTKPEWQNRIPAVVHPIDKTARAQIVVKEKNPKYWEIINQFYQKTGIPLLLNTSFNTHGEPIVRTLEDGLKHLNNGIVDILVAENKIFLKK